MKMSLNDPNLCSIHLISSNKKQTLLSSFQQTKATEAVCFVVLLLTAVLKATC